MHTFEKMAVCHKTDIGLARKKNEDSYLIVDFPENAHAAHGHGMIFVVADGLGGHPAGEVASDMACKGLLESYAEKNEQLKDTASPQIVLNHLEEAVWKTHKKIMHCADENRSYAGMGATLSALVLIQDRAFIAHVGDSRIYRLRHNILERLTEDDTMAQLSVEMGYLKPEEVSTHPLRHALSQAVGQDIDEVHTRMEDVKANDVFLLCSDGLYNMINDDEIKEILCNPVVEGACDELIGVALKRGCTDNVTVIVIRILP